MAGGTGPGGAGQRIVAVAYSIKAAAPQTSRLRGGVFSPKGRLAEMAHDELARG